MEDYDSLNRFEGTQVEATLVNGETVVGTLASFDPDFSIVLTGDGAPDPDNIKIGDLKTNYVEKETTFNGDNVVSVSEWKGE